jgi:AcrR family transcriptional regulator
MPRPSRNVDEQLLRAGRALFPDAGCEGLSLRRVASHAGVNLGMFHYHFKTKDTFVRRVLQGLYEEMFSGLQLAVAVGDPPLPALRRAVAVIAHFGRDNRRLLGRLVADAMNGQPLALEFLRANFPRHFAVIVGLVSACQQAGSMRPLPVEQAVAFLAGAVGAPILFGGLVATRWPDSELVDRLEQDVLSDDAIGVRIDLALAALSAPRAPA